MCFKLKNNYYYAKLNLCLQNSYVLLFSEGQLVNINECIHFMGGGCSGQKDFGI